jgi:hypothetical protein
MKVKLKCFGERELGVRDEKEEVEVRGSGFIPLVLETHRRSSPCDLLN